MPLVTKDGFEPTPDTPYIAVDQVAGSNEPWLAVRIEGDDDFRSLAPHFEKVTLIAVDFPSFADGRGFTIARHLRRLGYDGELRASGHVIADQYAHALACGFDGVEIGEALAERQPFEHWQAAAQKILPPYRAKLAG